MFITVCHASVTGFERTGSLYSEEEKKNQKTHRPFFFSPLSTHECSSTTVLICLFVEGLCDVLEAGAAGSEV